MATPFPSSAPRPRPPLTLYRVAFVSYDGRRYMLDTTNPDKIGPWLAEMFGLFPWLASSPTSVEINTIEGFH